MIRFHQSSALQTLSATPRRLHLCGALQLRARQAGWLWVDGGQVWITRDGGGPDHVLVAGERLFVARGERVLGEPWRVGETACLRWALAAPAPVAQAAGLRRGVREGVLRGAAAGLRALAGRLALAARKAEASARRAQGAISAGDSIASAGAFHQNASST